MATISSDLISNAELVSTLTSDAVVSVSTGVGQPQKNIKLGDLATVVAGLIPESILSTKGLVKGIQKIDIDSGTIKKITSSHVYSAVGYLVSAAGNGIRTLYFVNPAEFNGDAGQVPLVVKIGASWGNPVTFYYKKGSVNEIALSVQTNGQCSVFAFGYGAGNSLSATTITSTSDFTEISPKSLV